MHAKNEILSVNRAYYAAFAEKDLRTMDVIWARYHPVACIHPGWSALAGRDAVMASWQAIMSQSNQPVVQCQDEQVTIFGSMAMVVCSEVVESTRLVATNLFVQEDGAWRMVHHHAGPIPSALLELPDDSSTALLH